MILRKIAFLAYKIVRHKIHDIQKSRAKNTSGFHVADECIYFLSIMRKNQEGKYNFIYHFIETTRRWINSEKVSTILRLILYIYFVDSDSLRSSVKKKNETEIEIIRWGYFEIGIFMTHRTIYCLYAIVNHLGPYIYSIRINFEFNGKQQMLWKQNNAIFQRNSISFKSRKLTRQCC